MHKTQRWRSDRLRRSTHVLRVAAVVALAGFATAGDRETVSFETSDGVKIYGDFFPAEAADDGQPPFAILLHMYGQNRTTWRPLIGPLQKAGFSVLAIDLRGHGESATRATKERMEKRDSALFADMDKDVWAAYDWIAARGGVDRARFAIIGASVGCSVALRYASTDRSADAVVCLSPGLDYLGLDSKLDVKEITGRKLLYMACENERTAAEALKQASEGAQAKIYPGAAHGTNMLGIVPGVEKDIIDFLTSAVGKPTTTTVYGSIKSDDRIFHLAGSGWIDRIKPTNMRHWSSPEEAKSRGLRASKSRGPDDRPEAARNTDSGGSDDSRRSAGSKNAAGKRRVQVRP